MSEHTTRQPERDHPADEFDELPPLDGRRGAHRARPNPLLAMVPLLLVVVAVVAVVVGAMTLLGDDAPQAGGAGLAVTEPTQQPAPTAPAEGTAAPEDTSAPAGEETTAPPPEETSAPQGTVDTSVDVTVLNGTSTGGLAGGATARLREAGWTVPVADNFRDGPTPPTTVFYPSEELAATAEAVAEDLGGARTELSGLFGGDGLTVVLGDDYQA